MMAGGWSRDGAVQDQIDASVDDAVQQARKRLATGDSATHCEDCEVPIPPKRRVAVPGVTRCIACQEQHDDDTAMHSSFNRRGSKDSQLR